MEVYIIHLIRDPRAVVYSWQKKKENLWTNGLLETSFMWIMRNIIAELIGKAKPSMYIKIYYEELISNPIKTLEEKIMPFLSVESTDLFIGKENKVKLGINHGLCGNPGRFETGLTRLRLDTRWLEMKSTQKLAISALTLPVLLRHHYPLNLRNMKKNFGGVNINETEKIK